jgi:hypothetical protein
MVAHRTPLKSGMTNVVRAVLVVLICQLARNYITGFAILCQRVWRFFAKLGLIFLTLG